MIILSRRLASALVPFFLLAVGGGWAWTPPADMGASGASSPRIATNGAGDYMAVWCSGATNRSVNLAVSTDNSTTYSAPGLLSVGSFDNVSPTIASNHASTWIAAWTMTDGASSGTMVVRRSTNRGASWSGPTMLDPAGVSGFGSGRALSVTGTSGGTWLAVWATGSTVYASTSNNDALSWSSPTLVMSDPRWSDGLVPSVAVNGNNWLVAWHDVTVVSTNNGQIWGTPLVLSLTPLPYLDSDQQYYAYHSAATATGNGHWAVVTTGYREYFLFSSSGHERAVVVFESVDNGLTWDGGAFVARKDRSTMRSGDYEPSIQSDGQTILCADICNPDPVLSTNFRLHTYGRSGANPWQAEPDLAANAANGAGLTVGNDGQFVLAILTREGRLLVTTAHPTVSRVLEWARF